MLNNLLPIWLKKKYGVSIEKEQKKRIKAKKEAQKYAQEVIATARICLNEKSFIKYQKEYLKARKAIMQIIEEYHDPHPMQYALAMKELTTKLRDIGALLKDVQTDAKEENV